MRKFFTSLFLLTACSGHLLLANTGTGATAATGATASMGAMVKPMIDEDVTVSAIVSPAPNQCDLTAGEILTVTVQNLGNTDIYGGSVEIGFDLIHPTYGPFIPFSVGPQYIMDDILANSSVNYSFPDLVFMDVPGQYTFIVYVFNGLDTNNSNDTITFTFNNPGPTNYVDSFTPYIESFETASSGWFAYPDGTSTSSWALGQPNSATLTSASSGSNAWVTNLTGNYNSNEKSYVYSPCFDFTGVNPTIMVDVWWNTPSTAVGAKLQYTTNNGTTWTDVGALNAGENWYNNSSVSGLSYATGAQTGWSGDASNGWKTAILENAGLNNATNVRFRMAFGGNFSTPTEGFAFDNFRVFGKENDIKLVAIQEPVSGCDLGANTNVKIKVADLGTSGIFGATAQLIFTNAAGQTTTQNIPSIEINAGEDTVATFPTPVDLTTPGTYTFKVIVSYVLDPNNYNDTLTTSVVNAGPTIATFPYLNDFEGPSTWAAYSNNPNVPSSWEVGNPNGTLLTQGANGSTNAWVTNLDGNYNTNEQSYVLSPCFDFTGVDPVIDFDVWWNSNSAHGAKLQYTLDGGATWTNIGSASDANWYNDNSIIGLNWATGDNHGWAGTGNSSSGTAANSWVHVKHEWTGLFNQPSVRFRFAFGASTGIVYEGFAFDNFRITTKPEKDMAAVQLLPFPQGCGYSATEDIRIQIYNNGILPAVNFPVTYHIQDNLGSAPMTATEIVSDTIHPFTFHTYTFNQTANLADGNSFTFVAYVALPGDEDLQNDTINTGFLNSILTQPSTITFENGAPELGAFSTITRPQSGILINSAGAYGGSDYGLVLHGGTQSMPWSDFDALTKPFNTATNTDRFSSAIMCVKTPDSLSTLKLSFYLKQLYHNSNFLMTNFRVTVNGNPIPLTRGDGSIFTPAGNQQAIRPPVSVTGTGSTPWELITADLTSYLSDTIPSISIGFESSVKFTYDYTPSGGTANLIDSIAVFGTYDSSSVSAPAPIQAGLINVYPNPSQGEFTIDLNDMETAAYTMEVMDVTGKVIRKEMVKVNGQPNYTFNIANQAKGIYFLKVSSDTNVYTTKLILQ